MEGILPWICAEMHWIKLDYIQAKRKSAIGVLYRSTRLIDRDCTCASLKEIILSEIGLEYLRLAN